MKVKIKKLVPEAIIPVYAKEGDAGLDLTAVSMNFNGQENIDYSQSINGWRTGAEFIEYKTGLAIAIPKGFAGFILPRSSVSDKSLILSNCVGLIDSGYRGEIKVRFKYTELRDGYFYKIGERVAQLVILPYPEVELEEVGDLDETQRGTGGYGSTGK